MENKYANGTIYKLVDIAYTKCYVGSTCEKLSARMAKHRLKYKLYQEGRSPDKYTSFILFDEFGLDNVKIELIESFPCDNRDSVRKREGEYIRSECCVNKHYPNRTKSEYWQMTKESTKERREKYRSDHKEQRKEKDRLDRQNNKARIHEDAREQIQCNVCQCSISRRTRASHEKSLKHQSALNSSDHTPNQQQQVALALS